MRAVLQPAPTSFFGQHGEWWQTNSADGAASGLGIRVLNTAVGFEFSFANRRIQASERRLLRRSFARAASTAPAPSPPPAGSASPPHLSSPRNAAARPPRIHSPPPRSATVRAPTVAVQPSSPGTQPSTSRLRPVPVASAVRSFRKLMSSAHSQSREFLPSVNSAYRCRPSSSPTCPAATYLQSHQPCRCLSFR